MKLSICLVFILLSGWCFGQIDSFFSSKKFAEFEILPAEKTVMGKTCLFVHIKNKGTEVLTDSVFSDLAGCTGFSFPDKQPIAGYFIFCKRERKNGRLYVLTQNGDLRIIAGGSFWVAPKHKLLFVLAERDYTNLLIYDLKQLKVLIEKYNCDEFAGWYYRHGNYLGRVLEECGEDGKENEVSGIISHVMTEQFDVKTGSLNEMQVSEEDLEHAKKLVRYGMFKQQP